MLTFAEDVVDVVDGVWLLEYLVPKYQARTARIITTIIIFVVFVDIFLIFIYDFYNL
jgi:hypothetical protein